jgi:hypothetical protein
MRCWPLTPKPDTDPDSRPGQLFGSGPSQWRIPVDHGELTLFNTRSPAPIKTIPPPARSGRDIHRGDPPDRRRPGNQTRLLSCWKRRFRAVSAYGTGSRSRQSARARGACRRTCQRPRAARPYPTRTDRRGSCGAVAGGYTDQELSANASPPVGRPD